MKLVTHANVIHAVIGRTVLSGLMAESLMSGSAPTSPFRGGRQDGDRLPILACGRVARPNFVRLKGPVFLLVRSFCLQQKGHYGQRCRANSPLRRRKLGEATASTARVAIGIHGEVIRQVAETDRALGGHFVMRPALSCAAVPSGR